MKIQLRCGNDIQNMHKNVLCGISFYLLYPNIVYVELALEKATTLQPGSLPSHSPGD